MINLLRQSRRPDITFSRDGRIFITAKVAAMLDLRSGDCVNIAGDNGEFLLFATRHTNGRHRATVHPTKQGSHNFCANSVDLCRALFDAVGVTTDRVSYMIGDPIVIADQKYLPIITRLPL